mgnify:CR=1 FL=1
MKKDAGLKSNFHTHTFRCGHAKGDIKDYTKSAISFGFKNIGFCKTLVSKSQQWKSYISGLFNPTLYSPTSPYQIMFAQTKDSLMDVDVYRNFLYSAITRFRQSNFYRHYKAHLMQMGMDRCQLHPYLISDEDDSTATLEMHHHVLTIFDIALVITEHILNTYGYITSFDLAYLLRQVHEQHKVCIVMLCKTCHQLYTNHNDEFKIPSTLGFGKWWEFLDEYKYGITRDLAVKIYYMLKNDLQNADERDEKIKNMLSIRDKILDWSEYNEKLTRK